MLPKERGVPLWQEWIGRRLPGSVLRCMPLCLLH
jgi:hypothetical protein